MDDAKNTAQAATGGEAHPAGRKARRLDDGKAARQRMEQSILDARKARLNCGACGALGNWGTQSVHGETRYLLCGHCNVGTAKVTVTAKDLNAALGIPTKEE